MPEVAIVLPVFNPGNMLKRSLDSVVSQTFGDWECVVVDDGGSEDVQWAADLDPRVRVITQGNRGVSLARNAGAAASSARWLAFIDQDDEWLPRKLERQLQALSSGASWSYTGFIWVLDADERPSVAGTTDLAAFLGSGHISLSSFVVDRQVFTQVGGFHADLSQQQDAELFARLLAAREPSAPVYQPLVRTHIHGRNASGDYRRAYQERLLVLDMYGQRQAARFWRNVYGTQAFDDFRASRRPRALFDAARWAPRYTVKTLARRLSRRRKRAVG